MNGCLLVLVKEDQQVDVILEIWFVGIEGGNVIVDVLFGDYNLFGKLLMFFLCFVGQILVYYSYLNIGCLYNVDKLNKYILCYFDEVNGVFYLFGYGLSYIIFIVFDVKFFVLIMKCDGKVMVSVQVMNIGKCEGVMVVQMYLQDVMVFMSCFVKQLKGFEKIILKLGEIQIVSFLIDIEVLKFWN